MVRLRYPARVAWLVTGGAGYIGSHVVDQMCAAGMEVVVVDDLTSGDPARLAADVPLVIGSVRDGELMSRTLRAHAVRGVVHIAAKKRVDESVSHPLHYYGENVEGLRVVLEAAVDAGIGSFVFSSSAAVYGEPDVDVVTEDCSLAPVNPYGMTKLIGERMVQEVAATTGMRYANLRYFNVAGAARPELADQIVSNLVPMVFQRLTERRAPLIFGDDYSTPDGTCIRDFVHVSDIASAHVSAAQSLERGDVTALTANVGCGVGVSVRSMVSLIRSVTGTAEVGWAEPVIEARRPGDPARVVASADGIHAALGWRAVHGVEEMVASAWAGWLRRSV